MAMLRRSLFAAPLLMVLAFTGHLLNVMVIEPRLGFSSTDDFYDADRLLAVIDHPVWIFGALYHLLIALAVTLIVAESPDGPRSASASCAKAFGFGAAIAFVFVAMTNLVGMREIGTAAETGAGNMASINAAFVVGRTVLLNGAILLLGVFMLLANATRMIRSGDYVAARYLGLLAGLSCVLTIVIPAMAPAVLLSMILWGALSTVLLVKNR